MPDTIVSLWRSRLVQLAGFLAAAALGVLVDIKLPGTSHAAIFLPLAIGALTELGGIFGKFDPGVLNPRVRNLLMLAVGAVASYLTSTPSASGLRFAPAAIALLFSMQRLLAGTSPGGAAKVGVLLLAFVLPGVSSCAHFGPVVQEFSSCEEPDAQKICQEIKPRLIDLLACSGLDVDLAPPCAAAALADLYRDHGHFVVNCALLAIRDAFKAEPNAKPAELARASLIRARAEAFLDGEIKAGEKVPTAARTPGVRRNP